MTISRIDIFDNSRNCEIIVQCGKKKFCSDNDKEHEKDTFPSILTDTVVDISERRELLHKGDSPQGLHSEG